MKGNRCAAYMCAVIGTLLSAPSHSQVRSRPTADVWIECVGETVIMQATGELVSKEREIDLYLIKDGLLYSYSASGKFLEKLFSINSAGAIYHYAGQDFGMLEFNINRITGSLSKLTRAGGGSAIILLNFEGACVQTSARNVSGPKF